MITKATVLYAIPGTNKFKVRIPLFDGIDGGITSTPDRLLADATLCTLPNIDNVVRPGDVVFVAFEENDMGKPVILGQLYNPNKQSDTCVDLQVRTIRVEDKVDSQTSRAILPPNTKVGTHQNLNDMLFYFDNIDNH